MALDIRRISTGLVATAALIGAAACGRGAEPAPGDELTRELEAAAKPSQAAIDISPIEQGLPGVQRKAPIESRATVRPVARRTTRPQVKAPTRQAERAQPEPRPTVEEPQSQGDATAQDAPAMPTPAPATRPQVQPAPPGGYTPMGEIIRRAPFPINP